MNDKNSFKKTLYRYHHEASVLLRSNYNECPLPFQRFLEQIELEPEIKAYLDDCVGSHLPDGFDVVADVDAVMKSPNTIFGGFSTDPMGESAQIYLILQEIVTRGVKGDSVLFFGYGSKNLEKMYKGFMDRVVRRLIMNLDEHLSLIGIDMGLDDNSAISNTFNGPVTDMQFNQPIGNAVVNATQNNGSSVEELSSLINTAIGAIDSCNNELVQEIKDNLETIRSEMGGSSPKRGIVKAALGFIKSVDAGTKFAAAVTQICDYVGKSGIQL